MENNGNVENKKKFSNRKRKRKSKTNKNILKTTIKKNLGKKKYEIYKDKTIIINSDKSLIHLDPPTVSMNLFERKEIAQKLFLEKSYNIEDLLKYDNTNKEIQKKYLNIVVNEFIKKDSKIRKEILKEKIQKSGIILSQNDYDNEIKKIKNEKIEKDLQYIDYKLSIINTLESIQKYKNLEYAKKELNLKTIFYFNHESEIGDNNYFFYYLSIQLDLKLEELCYDYSYYDYIIEKSIDFLKNTNFSKLSDNEKYLFQNLSHLLFDENSIDTINEKEKVKELLKGECVKKEDLIKAIKERNIGESKNEPILSCNIDYKIDFDEKSELIKYSIIEKSKIDRKDYSNKHEISYDYKIFNTHIIETIKNSDLLNFEYDIFHNILLIPEYSGVFYKKIRPTFNKIIKEILNSKAAIDFFNNIYKNTYKKKYKKEIEYHFNNESVQNQILKRIIFSPLINERVNAFTNPLDLSIIINSIPGRFLSNRINYFNKKILNIGRLVLIAIHEIMGHYLRRYYSFITDREIPMDTNDDIIDTKPEGREYVEKNFLGFNSIKGYPLYLKEVLLFFYSKYIEKYPINDNYNSENIEILKYIINEYKDIFDFILVDEINLKIEENDDENYEENEEEEDLGEGDEDFGEEEEEEEDSEIKDLEKGYIKKKEPQKDESIIKQKETEEYNEKNKNAKITLSQFQNLICPPRKTYPAIISCGLRKNENYILL